MSKIYIELYEAHCIKVLLRGGAWVFINLYSLMLYHLFLFHSNEAEESDINKKVKQEYNIYYKLALHIHEFIDHTHYVYNSESCIISNHEFFYELNIAGRLRVQSQARS